MQFALNTLIAALVIATFTELSRRYSFISAILISLPFPSVVALSFIYVETHDVSKVSAMSMSIFWLVIPSLVFFVTLPLLLRSGFNFWISICLSLVTLSLVYGGYAFILRKFVISL